MYVLKSAASTGPRRMLAASQRWLSRFPRSTTADVFKQALHCRDGPAQCSSSEDKNQTNEKSRGPWKKGPRPHLTFRTAVLQ